MSLNQLRQLKHSLEKLLYAKGVNVAFYVASKQGKGRQFRDRVAETIKKQLLHAARLEVVSQIVHKSADSTEETIRRIWLPFISSFPGGALGLMAFFSWAASLGEDTASKKLDIPVDKTISIDRQLKQRIQYLGNTIDKTGISWVKQAIEEGAKQGLTGIQIVQMIRGKIQDLAKQRGKLVWETELMTAMNLMEWEVYKRNGVGKVTWKTSHDEKTCPICVTNEVTGTINIGKTFPSGDAHPPAHSYCLIGDTVIAAKGITKHYKRWFEGKICIIRISGQNITITPNHPILTEFGWIPARNIKVGDSIYQRIGWNKFMDNPDDNYVVSRIDQIPSTLNISGNMSLLRMPVTRKDFHGDGIVNTKVDIIKTDSFFSNNIIGQFVKFLKNKFLRIAHLWRKFFSMLSSQNFFLNNKFTARSSLMSLPRPFHSNFGSSPLSLENVSFAYGSNKQTQAFETISYSRRTTSDAPSQIRRRFSSKISLVKVDNVVMRKFSGHVYNLETESGYYFANSIITHNCRCYLLPIVAKMS